MASGPVYDFVNFELFYDRWYSAFKRKSDPLVLFFHYMMIQNEFKLLHLDTLKKSELLPSDWNDFDTKTEFAYYKHSQKVLVEANKGQKTIDFVAKLDHEESTLSLAVDDYINANYSLNDYTKVFKMDTVFQLYSDIQTCINMMRMEPEACDRSECGASCCCGQAPAGLVHPSTSSDTGVETESGFHESPSHGEAEKQLDETTSASSSQPLTTLVPKPEPDDPLVMHQIRKCQVVVTDFTSEFIQLRAKKESKPLKKRRKSRMLSVSVKGEPVDREPVAKRVKREPSVPAKLVARSKARIQRRNTIQSTTTTTAPPRSVGSRSRLSLSSRRPSQSLAMIHLDEIINDLLLKTESNP